MTSKKIIQKCRKIKLIISDVDGVLTDGGMYYSKTGEVMKKFNAKDGMGVELLRKKIWDSERPNMKKLRQIFS